MAAGEVRPEPGALIDELAAQIGDAELVDHGRR